MYFQTGYKKDMANNEYIIKLGKRIAFFRKQKRLNQFELAEISGKMLNTISNIERGLAVPKIDTLKSITDALNINICELFNEEATDNHPPLLREIINLLQNEDELTLKIIQKQIELAFLLKNRK